jgi:hypothetical protein
VVLFTTLTAISAIITLLWMWFSRQELLRELDRAHQLTLDYAGKMKRALQELAEQRKTSQDIPLENVAYVSLDEGRFIEIGFQDAESAEATLDWLGNRFGCVIGFEKQEGGRPREDNSPSAPVADQ